MTDFSPPHPLLTINMILLRLTTTQHTTKRAKHTLFAGVSSHV